MLQSYNFRYLHRHQMSLYITYCISYMNPWSEYRIRYLLYNNILVLLKFVTEKFSTLVSFLTFVNKQFRIMSLLKYRMHHCLIVLKRIIEGNTDITTVTFAWAFPLKITYSLQACSLKLVYMWLRRHLWRMFVTRSVGDKFEMFVTDIVYVK